MRRSSFNRSRGSRTRRPDRPFRGWGWASSCAGGWWRRMGARSGWSQSLARGPRSISRCQPRGSPHLDPNRSRSMLVLPATTLTVCVQTNPVGSGFEPDRPVHAFPSILNCSLTLDIMNPGRFHLPSEGRHAVRRERAQPKRTLFAGTRQLPRWLLFLTNPIDGWGCHSGRVPRPSLTSCRMNGCLR